jgi:pyruvate formate lyase activating enzyme
MTGEGAASGIATCDVCPHHCRLEPGALGACQARRNVDGSVACEAYGRLTSIAIDPVEKKPLARWMPGSRVLSVGGYGCNLHCPFCQNWRISQAGSDDVRWREVGPDELVSLAMRERDLDPHMVGIAFTYNEPLVCWEYVRDCSRLAHRSGLKTVLVSNGYAEPRVVDELAPLLDAANIDLKSFSPDFYKRCGGDLDAVRKTIRRLSEERTCHLEVTTLVVPGMNDEAGEMDDLAGWLASLPGDITLHVTRFFPNWRMSNASPTPVPTVRHLAEVARRRLPHVFVGNC